MESYRLPDPKSEREKLGNQMGADGFYLGASQICKNINDGHLFASNTRE